jgi:hypothetical protein
LRDHVIAHAEDAMTIDALVRGRQRLGENTFADIDRSLKVVCLFSTLGLVLTFLAMTSGWFDEISRVAAKLAY